LAYPGDDFTRISIRGQESNLRPPGSKPGVTANSNCPGAEAVGLEPTNGFFHPPPVFETGSSSGRSTSVFSDFSSGGRNRTCGLLGQNQASLPAATAPELRLSHTLLTLAYEVRFAHSFKSALRELNPPVRFGRPVPQPLCQGHISLFNQSKTPAQRALREISAPAAGIEPASTRLTAEHPYQHEYHRN
jgi:hypothetical protein